MRKLLGKLGVTHVTVVPEQEKPDGDFPTCPYPNPEIREAMQKGLELCDKVHPDLLLGTDPDCDRCGAAVPDGQGGYRLITGNEMGHYPAGLHLPHPAGQRHDAQRPRRRDHHRKHRYGDPGRKEIRR